MFSFYFYSKDIAGIIQLHTGQDTAGLQNSSRSFDKVDTSRLLHVQCQHHLHHLEPQHKINSTLQEIKQDKWNQFYLNLCIGLSCTDVASIFHQILQQFASRGRPQHRGVFLLLKYTSLVADSDAVAGEFEQFKERLGKAKRKKQWMNWDKQILECSCLSTSSFM